MAAPLADESGEIGGTRQPPKMEVSVMSRISKLTLFAALGASLTLLSGAGAQAQNVPGTVSVTVPYPSFAGSYWTPEKMRAAIPLDAGLRGSPRPNPNAAPGGPTGSPGAAGGRPPGRGAMFPSLSGAALRAVMPTAASGSPVGAGAAYPGPQTTYYYGPKYVTYPVSTIGKLFFTINGAGYVCSASVTTGSASINNIIWTAGHCVANGGASTFYSNWVFCPSYNSGGVNPTRGCWNATGATTTTAWFANGDWTRDYAYITLANLGSVLNEDVALATGSLGFGYNFGRDEVWTHLGYPQASPYNGSYIVQTNTQYAYTDTGQTGASASPNSWGSRQTPGSSGSALLLGFSYASPGDPYGQAPWINSTVSYYYTAESNFELQGPYYDTFACSVWQQGTGWTGTC